MFSDPVNFIDPNGKIAVVTVIIVVVVVVVVGGIIATLDAAHTTFSRMISDRHSQVDAGVNGTKKDQIAAHNQMKKDAALFQVVPQLASLTNSLGKGIPKDNKSALINGINRLYKEKDNIMDMSQKFFNESDDESAKQCK